MRPEKPCVGAGGRGFDSRHLHTGCSRFYAVDAHESANGKRPSPQGWGASLCGRARCRFPEERRTVSPSTGRSCPQVAPVALRRTDGALACGVTSGRLTYDEVGATGATLPTGYDHVRRSRVVGHGAADFERAAEAVMTWQLHRLAGLAVVADAPRAAVGVDVRLGLGIGRLRLAAACRVVTVAEQAAARGFAYGTLPGHPESGEESFLVRQADDGTVSLHVVAFSRPDRWFSRLGAPATRAVQKRLTDRYLAALTG